MTDNHQPPPFVVVQLEQYKDETWIQLPVSHLYMLAPEKLAIRGVTMTPQLMNDEWCILTTTSGYKYRVYASRYHHLLKIFNGRIRAKRTTAYKEKF